MKKLRGLDLFSGIGGISLGLERTGGFETVAFCEIDPYCRGILTERFPDVEVFDDVRTLPTDQFRGGIDIVAGGFPCQDISVAGKQEGLGGARSGLWFEMFRIVREVRPRWVLVENVANLRTLGADRVLEDLESEGYSAWPCVVGADDVGAPHRRRRVWIVAHRDGGRCERSGEPESDGFEGTRGDEPDGCGERGAGGALYPCWIRCDACGDFLCTRHGGHVADCEYPDIDTFTHQGVWPYVDDGLVHASGQGLEGHGPDAGQPEGCESGRTGSSSGGCLDDANGQGLREPGETDARHRFDGAWAGHRDATRDSGAARWPARPGCAQYDWEPPRVTAPQPRLGGNADGLPGRLESRIRRERLKALGNSVVPQVVEAIGRAILKASE